MNIFDSHIHIGQFRELYSTPQEVLNFLLSVGVDRFAVSSTTICNGEYDKVLSEMIDIVDIGNEHIAPVLWIAPKMLTNGYLQKFLDNGICWKCLKVHGYFHDWHSDMRPLQQVVELARQMSLPLLFHTGGRSASDAGSYANIIKNNPDVRFILAHSRPIVQTLAILETNSNVYADTAFTPIEDVGMLIDKGFVDKVLFGTDYPLPRVFYPNANMQEYYKSLVLQYINTIGETNFLTISNRTPYSLFS